METIRVSLCPKCAECPEVVVSDDGVSIGEDENTVRLAHAEWNELVEAIRSGKLQTVELQTVELQTVELQTVELQTVELHTVELQTAELQTADHDRRA